MPWGEKSKSYTFKKSREKKSVQELSYTKKPQKTVKAVHTGQKRSMEPKNLKRESCQEFYKVYRPREPPKTINVE